MAEPREGALPPQPHSQTAATRGNALYGESGAMLYRVTIKGGMGFTFCDVEARTGDEAAGKALEQYPGTMVAHVEPAPQKQKAA